MRFLFAKYGIYFTRAQRRGVVALCVLVLCVALGYQWLKKATVGVKPLPLSVDLETQVLLDSLLDLRLREDAERTKQSYNPNYINEYRAETIGLSVAEFQRLQSYRAQGLFINSVEEFQKVTQVSDKWLSAHKEEFKFPEWVNQKKQTKVVNTSKQTTFSKSIPVRDINQATQEELMEVYGIGQVFSRRILEEREKFGGFVSLSQLDYVWGIPPETVEEIKKYFRIETVPKIVKIKVNTAGIEEFRKLPYFNYYLAKDAVAYRTEHGDFKTMEDFQQITNFPLGKLEVIGLYLDFEE